MGHREGLGFEPAAGGGDPGPEGGARGAGEPAGEGRGEGGTGPRRRSQVQRRQGVADPRTHSLRHRANGKGGEVAIPSPPGSCAALPRSECVRGSLSRVTGSTPPSTGRAGRSPLNCPASDATRVPLFADTDKDRAIDTPRTTWRGRPPPPPGRILARRRPVSGTCRGKRPRERTSRRAGIPDRCLVFCGCAARERRIGPRRNGPRRRC